MDKKKELILVLTVVLIVVNLLNILFFVLTNSEGNSPDLTGQATQVQGTTTLCINSPPSFTVISNQNAIINTLFTYQVSASDANDDLFTFSDNTSLFEINSSGYISFTPATAGTHTILITATESRSCTNHSVSTTMILGIAEETAPVVTPTPSGGGGGGGGGGYKIPVEETPIEEFVPKFPASFQMSDELVKVTLKKSQSLHKNIIITNDGGQVLNLEINSPTNLIEVEPVSFSLDPGDNHEINLVFNPKKEAQPGVYNGEIQIEGKYIDGEQTKVITEVITYILEIESERVLFDGSLDLRKNHLLRGDNLEATLTISGLLPGTVKLIYVVTDKEGVVLLTKEEEVSIEEQVSFTKKITLPEGLAPGEYVLSVKIVSGDSFASTTELFIIEAGTSALIGLAAPLAKSTAFLIGVPLLLVLTLISLVVFYAYHFFTGGKILAWRGLKNTANHSVRNSGRSKLLDDSIFRDTQEVSSLKKVKLLTIKQATLNKPEVKLDVDLLKRKLSLLEESYTRGFIRKESYFKAKENLQRIIGKGK
ncbi:hypothetical protein HYU21_01315 [Candidatus Woesearchaeota archaeon]|nr:hypothetical protein [Candidatus Woesearchaeota archaeon]